MIKPITRKQAEKPPFKLSLLQKILLVLGLIILMFTSLPMVVILLIGLLPSLTIMLVDSKNTNKLIIVGCCNIAGMFICLTSILNQYNLNQQIYILSNIFNIVIMLGAAAFGMILYFELPNIFSVIFKNSAHRRLRSIDNKLDKIAEDWGRDIINELNK
mgnify:CR=1 FL=1